VIEPAEEQQEEVEDSCAHVDACHVLEPGHPLEVLLAYQGVEVFDFRMGVGVAVLATERPDVTPEMPRFHCANDASVCWC